MKAEVGRPDAMPPGVRRLIYWGFCWVNRNPMVFRAVGAVLRFWPVLSRVFPVAARGSAVKHVLTRPNGFSNTSHTKNLIAGDFLIGMDPGPAYSTDKALFASVLDRLWLTVQTDADQEAKARIAQVTQRLDERSAPTLFDLVEDYLMWVVFRAIEPSFGAAAAPVVSGRTTGVPDDALERHYLREVRHVAAHLFAGRLAPVDVQRRAEVSATSLRARIQTIPLEIGQAWGATTAAFTEIRRNAVGLAWVSHPVTVQSAALIVQELLGRPALYKSLREQAASLGADVWSDPINGTFRTQLRDHVLELMRFRPVFPLLSRDVPRETAYESGGRRNPVCPAGSQLTVLSIAALFDSHHLNEPSRYCPHRNWGAEAPSRYLMFGLGERQCPAKDHAVTIMTSALIGLLTLPELTWADAFGQRIQYDGPMISRMRLRAA